MIRVARLSIGGLDLPSGLRVRAEATVRYIPAPAPALRSIARRIETIARAADAGREAPDLWPRLAESDRQAITDAAQAAAAEYLAPADQAAAGAGHPWRVLADDPVVIDRPALTPAPAPATAVATPAAAASPPLPSPTPSTASAGRPGRGGGRGQAADRRRAIVAALRRAGANGLTDPELQAATGLSGDQERPRRVELVAAGQVIDSGRRRATASGRYATVWRLRDPPGS